MKIGRESSFYRPYAIVVNNRGYYVENICFYNESGVVVSTNFGWLENNNGGDIKEIELPIEEIKLRRKENFDGKVFAMTNKDKYTNETRMKLYIPCDMLDIHFVENEYNKAVYDVYSIYKGNQEIKIKQFVKSVDVELQNIRSEYEELYKNVSESYLYIKKTDDVIANLEKMTELAKEYGAEKKRLRNLTIDDIEL